MQLGKDGDEGCHKGKIRDLGIAGPHLKPEIPSVASLYCLGAVQRVAGSRTSTLQEEVDVCKAPLSVFRATSLEKRFSDQG